MTLASLLGGGGGGVLALRLLQVVGRPRCGPVLLACVEEGGGEALALSTRWHGEATLATLCAGDALHAVVAQRGARGVGMPGNEYVSVALAGPLLVNGRVLR